MQIQFGINWENIENVASNNTKQTLLGNNLEYFQVQKHRILLCSLSYFQIFDDEMQVQYLYFLCPLMIQAVQTETLLMLKTKENQAGETFDTTA